jgi:hypothetical protein
LKEDRKGQITASFYSAYFNVKGKNKGLSGKDLQKVLDKIDGNDGNEMSAEEILAVCKSLL